MANNMAVQAQLTQGSSFTIQTGSGHTIVLDSPPDKGGVNAGPRPMEMLLTALAGCAGIGIIGILRKMHQDVTNYEVRVNGTRAETNPQVFTHITVEHIFTGHNLQAASIQRAIDLDRENYCGANAMLSKAANVEHTFQIIEA
ncbi:MAG TPA: OsmC family protein [Dictyobacter sp.]|nr:OsmC family protein [Dictyobacter sp.]